eukprot:CAMPEP_0202816644 /NCGR_PEP_ID=MMETSP1389-20130828/7083_1 /ASSEMBLY_ACC=CAM_ASM_000865 /TAXON_ID=302021 /ORGANISM="Rhodomonas sp., Strain CCMP768" /LENGTH=305 /DNA_ID=CAMNT_0049488721 /DNA_START=270 /DNA_END=1186 /DNA_ORIENTATION=-
MSEPTNVMSILGLTSTTSSQPKNTLHPIFRAADSTYLALVSFSSSVAAGSNDVPINNAAVEGVAQVQQKHARRQLPVLEAADPAAASFTALGHLVVCPLDEVGVRHLAFVGAEPLQQPHRVVPHQLPHQCKNELLVAVCYIFSADVDHRQAHVRRHLHRIVAVLDLLDLDLGVFLDHFPVHERRLQLLHHLHEELSCAAVLDEAVDVGGEAHRVDPVPEDALLPARLRVLLFHEGGELLRVHGGLLLRDLECREVVKEQCRERKVELRAPCDDVVWRHKFAAPHLVGVLEHQCGPLLVVSLLERV